MTFRPTLVALTVAALGLSGDPPEAARLRDLRAAFATPPDDSRIMMRWWWFGPAVTKAGLEREMRLMKEGGIGGFEIQPVYPLSLDDPQTGIRNLRYLSPEFLDALRFTADKARELGLRADLTLGSGWPYGGPHIPISMAAGRLRCERVPVAAGASTVAKPTLAESEELISVFVANGDRRSFAPDGIQELAVKGEAGIELPVPGGQPRVVLFFISSHTRQAVKRASVGAEGPVLNHYDAGALERHLEAVGEPLLKGFGPRPPEAIFCDSLEVFGSDWTPDLLAEFQKRRGYDLRPYLPALVGNIGEKTGAIRNDWALTLSELAEERFLIPLQAWARAKKTRLRIQNYGVPPVTLASNGIIDLPEGEGSHWNRFTTSRWASSAGHLFGKPVISSETWTWLHSPVLRATPLDMKAEADRHFLQGINQLVGHGWPYSPESAGEPGWRFYAAAVFNQSNPWWIVMPEITRYLQRVSFLLRQGKPANDVALYLPVADARAAFGQGEASINRTIDRILGCTVVSQILAAGFGMDLVDDGVIGSLGKVEKGALAINGQRFRIVVLPNVERMPAATYRKLEAFVKAGGVLVATRRTPSLAPGLIGAEAETEELRAISRRLFEGPDAPAHMVAEEQNGLAPALRRLYQPDLAVTDAAEDIGFIRRTTPFAEIYFLANTANASRTADATFRVAGMEPEWWDPFSGATEPAMVKARPRGGITVALDLAPYESRVLVFSRRAAQPALPPIDGASEPVNLSTGWKVTFESGGRAQEFGSLRSWTDNPETRFYSGRAVYTRTVTVPRADVPLVLDFGEGTPVPEVEQRQPGMRAWLESPVREAAVVYVNGQRAGSVWRPPYRVPVTGLIRPGKNEIRLVVANLAINRMAGNPLPDYAPLHAKYGRRFDPQDMENLQPLPAGVLGPVRLMADPGRPAVLTNNTPGVPVRTRSSNAFKPQAAKD